eukprot:m.60403 g.60403  ORF g.60403 m.60403 type:complete len:516 (+) comp13660_c0_seq1:243-1790(+)
MRVTASVAAAAVVLAALLASAMAVDNAALNLDHEQQHTQHRVAVIGAGLGGAAVARLLRERHPAAEIHVYEAADRAGGRCDMVEHRGTRFEAGASVIHGANRYMVAWAEECGLEKTDPVYSINATTIAAVGMAILKGRKVVFQSSRSKLFTLVNMVWRYGYSLPALYSLIEGVLKQFLTIYDKQRANESFADVKGLLDGMGLYNLSQQSLHSYLSRLAPELVDEFAAAVSRVNYGQDTGINAFAGAVSLSAALSDDLWAVKGGNHQVAECLLRKSGASVHFNTKAEKVEFADEDISSSSGSGSRRSFSIVSSDGQRREFDAVVLASPLETAGVQLPQNAASRVPARRMQTTHATFLEARLRVEDFGLSQPPPRVLLTCETADAPFSSAGILASYENGTNFYKVFSRQAVTDAELDALFSDIVPSSVQRLAWQAYPVLTPPAALGSFELADGLFYLNAIETAASALEMSAVAANNVALLVSNHLNTFAPVKQQQQPKQQELKQEKQPSPASHQEDL